MDYFLITICLCLPIFFLCYFINKERKIILDNIKRNFHEVYKEHYDISDGIYFFRHELKSHLNRVEEIEKKLAQLHKKIHTHDEG